MVTQLRAGSPKNGGSIHGRDKGLSSFRSLQTDPGDPRGLLSNGCRTRSSRDLKATSHVHLARRKRIGGTIPPLRQMPSWRIYIYIYIYVCVCVCVCVCHKSRQGHRLSCLNIFVVFLHSCSDTRTVSLLGQGHVLPSLSPFIIAPFILPLGNLRSQLLTSSCSIPCNIQFLYHWLTRSLSWYGD